MKKITKLTICGASILHDPNLFDNPKSKLNDGTYLLIPLCPLLGRKAITISLHLSLFCAACCASLHGSFTSLSSTMTVRRQVVFGRPSFLLPCGVHRKANYMTVETENELSTTTLQDSEKNCESR